MRMPVMSATHFVLIYEHMQDSSYRRYNNSYTVCTWYCEVNLTSKKLRYNTWTVRSYSGIIFVMVLLPYLLGAMGNNGSEYFDNATNLSVNRNESNEDYAQFIEYYHFRTITCTVIFGPLIVLGLVGNIVSFFTWGKLTHQNSLTFLLLALALDWLVFTTRHGVSSVYEQPSLYEYHIISCWWLFFYRSWGTVALHSGLYTTTDLHGFIG